MKVDTVATYLRFNYTGISCPASSELSISVYHQLAVAL